jgi:coenzyme F420-reducing hydrogenase alpha subunit
VFGLIAADPDLARAGIRLRQFGQQILELLGGPQDPCGLGRARWCAHAPQ